MTKNESIARWLNWNFTGGCASDFKIGNVPEIKLDYNTLHKAWITFRDLKFQSPDYYRKHAIFKNDISALITHGTIEESFELLIKGIEWYNDLSNKISKIELIANWLGWTKGKENTDVADIWFRGEMHKKFWDFNDPSLLYEAWTKFRDLKYRDDIFFSEEESKENDKFLAHIGMSILYKPVSDSFNELIKGIEWWYNIIKKNG